MLLLTINSLEVLMLLYFLILVVKRIVDTIFNVVNQAKMLMPCNGMYNYNGFRCYNLNLDVQWCYYALVGHGVGQYMLSTDVIVPVGFRSKYQQLFGCAQMLLC